MQFISGHLGAASSLIDLSYSGRAGTSTNGSTYNFTVIRGAAHANRRIIVCVGFQSASSTITVSSFQTGGGSIVGTAVGSLRKITSGGVTLYAVIYIFDTPTGTTSFSPQMVLSASATGCDFSSFRMVNSTATPHATAFAQVTGDPSTTLTIPANGGAVAFNSYISPTLGVTWTGLTEADEATYDAAEDANASSATDVFATLQTSMPLSVNTTGATHSVLVAASWPS